MSSLSDPKAYVVNCYRNLKLNRNEMIARQVEKIAATSQMIGRLRAKNAELDTLRPLSDKQIVDYDRNLEFIQTLGPGAIAKRQAIIGYLSDPKLTWEELIQNENQ